MMTTICGNSSQTEIGKHGRTYARPFLSNRGS